MSDKIKVTGAPTSYTANVDYIECDTHRKYAVKLALELIHAHAASGCGEGVLDRHIENLGNYTDAIEDAMKREA